MGCSRGRHGNPGPAPAPRRSRSFSHPSARPFVTVNTFWKASKCHTQPSFASQEYFRASFSASSSRTTRGCAPGPRRRSIRVFLWVQEAQDQGMQRRERSRQRSRSRTGAVLLAHAPHPGLLPHVGISPWDEDAGEASAGHRSRSLCFFLCNRFYSARSRSARPRLLLPSQSPGSSQSRADRAKRRLETTSFPWAVAMPGGGDGQVPSKLPPTLQVPVAAVARPPWPTPFWGTNAAAAAPRLLPCAQAQNGSRGGHETGLPPSLPHCRVVWAPRSPLCSLRHPLRASHSSAEPSALPRRGLSRGHRG